MRRWFFKCFQFRKTKTKINRQSKLDEKIKEQSSGKSNRILNHFTGRALLICRNEKWENNTATHADDHDYNDTEHNNLNVRRTYFEWIVCYLHIGWRSFRWWWYECLWWNLSLLLFFLIEIADFALYLTCWLALYGPARTNTRCSSHSARIYMIIRHWTNCFIHFFFIIISQWTTTRNSNELNT